MTIEEKMGRIHCVIKYIYSKRMPFVEPNIMLIHDTFYFAQVFGINLGYCFKYIEHDVVSPTLYANLQTYMHDKKYFNKAMPIIIIHRNSQHKLKFVEAITRPPFRPSKCSREQWLYFLKILHYFYINSKFSGKDNKCKKYIPHFSGVEEKYLLKAKEIVENNFRI